MSGVTTARYADPFSVARETGAVHGEHLLGILVSTHEDRRAALVEGGRIRLGRFICDNMPADAPAAAIVDAAFKAFDATIHAHNVKLEKESNRHGK
jgi:hypothetical protein